ncbi:MAG: CPBP family intramembrane metalloprotease [Planctomycetaceae bacterium]|jgi:membrane protease YdiL (CAAX protease family)|nr:CPBP family intramembrane metalloprotease [Planctomycetaceae bacterium]
MTTSPIINDNGETTANTETTPQPKIKRLRFADVLLLIVGNIVLSVILLLITFAVISLTGYRTNQQNTVTVLHEIPEHETTTNLTGENESKATDGIRLGGGDKPYQSFHEIKTYPTPAHNSHNQSTAQQQANNIDHPLIRLLSKDQEPLVILMAFIFAVIAAPLTEEFLYRGVLVGWLAESTKIYLPKFGCKEKDTQTLGILLALVLPALYFALLHFGSNSELTDDIIFATFVAISLANFITLFAGIFYLTTIRNFTLEQIGFRMDKWRSDIFWAFVISIFIIPMILIFTGCLHRIFPNTVIDPIPLFFFAIVLGIIFITTHRLLPCILIHAFLNATSFTILVYGLS